MTGAAPLALALRKALRFYRAPGIGRLILLCILLSALMLGGFMAGIVMLFSGTQWFGNRWIEAGSDFFGMMLGGVTAWFLFPVILPVIAGFFAEKAASRIERAEGMQTTFIPDNFATGLLYDLRFAGVALLLNLALLPVYFIPLVNLFAYYGVNGYLLGREFFLMAAGRALGRKGADALRRRHGGTVFAGGLLIALTANIPFLNLVAPFFGIALMVHLARPWLPEEVKAVGLV